MEKLSDTEIENLRFPVGRFEVRTDYSAADVSNWINTIEAFPEKLKHEVLGLSEEQLDWGYRPDGWSIRQVVHHCADSHINSIARFKLALTEEKPAIRPYNEALWAELSDTTLAPITWSLDLLFALHRRWGFLLRHITPEELERLFYHPEYKREYTIGQNIHQYAWHCDHHLEHVKLAKKLRY